MGEHAVRRYGVARHDVAAQGKKRRHLPGGKGLVAVFTARIDELDADGMGVNVLKTRPVRYTGMPGTFIFVDILNDGAVAIDHVMGADAAAAAARIEREGEAALRRQEAEAERARAMLALLPFVRGMYRRTIVQPAPTPSMPTTSTW